jgi:hypothetical protein
VTQAVTLKLDYQADIATSGGGSAHQGRVSVSMKF